MAADEAISNPRPAAPVKEAVGVDDALEEAEAEAAAERWPVGEVEVVLEKVAPMALSEERGKRKKEVKRRVGCELREEVEG